MSAIIIDPIRQACQYVNMLNLDQDSLYEAIGARVRTLRNKADLSQDALADEMGLLRTSISNIETGKQRLTIFHLYKLSLALGADLSDILPPIKDYVDPDIFSTLDLENLPEKTESVLRKYRNDK